MQLTSQSACCSQIHFSARSASSMHLAALQGVCLLLLGSHHYLAPLCCIHLNDCQPSVPVLTCDRQHHQLHVRRAAPHHTLQTGTGHKVDSKACYKGVDQHHTASDMVPGTWLFDAQGHQHDSAVGRHGHRAAARHRTGGSRHRLLGF